MANPITIEEIKDLLSPEDVAREFGIPTPTQKQWRYLNRHGWRDVGIKLGGKVRYRRADLEEWLNSRKGV